MLIRLASYLRCTCPCPCVLSRGCDDCRLLRRHQCQHHCFPGDGDGVHSWVSSENESRLSTICDRFNAKTGGPALAYVDNSYIADYLLTANFSTAYLNTLTGVHVNAFYQTMNITMAPSGTTVAFQLGNLNGTLMTGPYTGNAFFSSPNFYQVQALGTSFGNFDPVTGKAGTLNMGLDTIDPTFVRVN